MPIYVPTLNQAVGNGAGAAPGNSQGAYASGASAAGSPPVAPDYNGLPINAPRVWQTNRNQAADRVHALSNSGMEDFEIPAFLRKQAD